MMGRSHLVSLLDELQRLSQHTIERLASLNDHELMDFVDRRAEIVHAMEPCRHLITEEDKQLISQLLLKEKVILDKMHAMKKEAGEWLQNLGAIRVQQHAYHQAYSIDSLFIDRRK